MFSLVVVVVLVLLVVLMIPMVVGGDASDSGRDGCRSGSVGAGGSSCGG